MAMAGVVVFAVHDVVMRVAVVIGVGDNRAQQ